MESASKKIALITGIGGQTGFFLSQFLIGKDYIVYGLLKEDSRRDIGTLKWLSEDVGKRIIYQWGTINDLSFLFTYISKINPDEIYHLAGQSDFESPYTTSKLMIETNIMGTLNLLEVVKLMAPRCKVFFAGSSMQFDYIPDESVVETSKISPSSMFGVSKLTAYMTAKLYREKDRLFISTGFLFNHISEMLQGSQSLALRIIMEAKKIHKKEQELLIVENLDDSYEWGYTGDYVEAMWEMLNRDQPEDFIVATGECHTVRELVKTAFSCLEMDITWSGKGDEEVGTDVDGIVKVRVSQSRAVYREAKDIKGNYKKAQEIFGWKPKKSFKELVEHLINTCNTKYVSS